VQRKSFPDLIVSVGTFNSVRKLKVGKLKGLLDSSVVWGKEPKPNKKDSISVTCPAGSIVYFLGTTYHSGGPNRSDKPRHALTIQYCQPYIRLLEDLMLSVDPRKLDQIPEKVVDMMGYKSGFPFLGSGTLFLITNNDNYIN